VAHPTISKEERRARATEGKLMDKHRHISRNEGMGRGIKEIVLPLIRIGRGTSHLMKSAKRRGRDAHLVCDNRDAKTG
jgi:hypothetical protein